MNEIQKAIANARLAQKERIMGSFSNSGELLGDQEFEKARSGIYADTAENRKLGRVGQEYGGSKKQKGDSLSPEFKSSVRNMYSDKLKIQAESVKEGTSEYKGTEAKFILEEFKRRHSGGFKDIEEGDDISLILKNKRGVVEGELTKLENDEIVVELSSSSADYWGIIKWRFEKNELESVYRLKKRIKKSNEGNPFDEAAEEIDIEKSDILNALDQGNVKLSKSGKEIKEKANAALSGFLTEAATFKDLALRLLPECGSAPTKKADYFWMSHLKLEPDLMIYDWDELYIPRENGLSEDTFSAQDAASKKKNRPENDEQAEARRDYNEQVREYCETLVDIRACEILVNNVKDGGSYELTPRQLIALNF